MTPPLPWALLEQSAAEGVQPAELLSGLIDLIRDAMILAIGGADSMLLAISPRNRSQLKTYRRPMDPADSILASLQILSGMPGPDARECSRAIAARNRPGSRRPPRRARRRSASLVERLVALESGAPPPRRPEPSSVKAKPAAIEADGSPIAALAAQADGTRSVPAPSEAQTTSIAMSAPAPVPTRPRTPIAEAAPARDDPKLGEIDLKPSPGAPFPSTGRDICGNAAERDATGCARAAGVAGRYRSASPRVVRQWRSGGSAVDGLPPPRSGLPEPVVAKAQAVRSADGADARRWHRRRRRTARRGDGLGGCCAPWRAWPAGSRRGRKLWPDLVKKVARELGLEARPGRAARARGPGRAGHRRQARI